MKATVRIAAALVLCACHATPAATTAPEPQRPRATEPRPEPTAPAPAKHEDAVALTLNGADTRADPWDTTSITVDAVGLPALSADGKRVAFVERWPSPASEAPTVDTNLVIGTIEAPQRVMLVGNEEWMATLPAPGTVSEKQAEAAFADLRASISTRIAAANDLLSNDTWVPMNHAALKVHDPDAARSLIELGNRRIMLKAAERVPTITVEDASGNALWQRKDERLLATHAPPEGWEHCARDRAQLLEAWAAPGSNVLLVLVTQWRSADACSASRIYQVYPTTAQFSGGA